jgi:sugar lactone lactonase YvrE
MRLFAAATASTVLLTACVGDLIAPNRGKVAVEVKWPQKAGYSVKAIPEGTVRIELTIVGEGLDSGPIKETLTPNDQATSKDIIDVPIGPKALTAIAYDANGKQTASGTDTVKVTPNAITPARIVLEGVTIVVPVTSPTPIPTGGPSATPTPSLAPDLIIRTVAGDGTAGATNGYASIDGRFRYPQSMVYDAAKNVIYIADTANRLIRKYDVKTTLLTTVVGTAPVGDASPPPVPSLSGSQIGTPGGLAIGPEGLLYFTDLDAHVVRRLNADGTLSVVAGSGRPGPAKENVSQYEASFYYPVAIAFDPNGALYIADQFNHKIRRFSTRGQITTIAGTGDPGSKGDGGPAVEAELNFPTAMTFDPKGEYLYVVEALSRRVRRIHIATGVITPVAGNGTQGVKGEGGPALQAQLDLPQALAFDKDGRLLIAEGWALDLGPQNSDEVGASNRVLRVEPDGKLVRIAGQQYGNYGFAGDGEDALKATFSRPAGLTVDAAGLIYVADCYNNRIRALVPGQPAPLPTASASPAPAPSASPVDASAAARSMPR